MLHRLFRRCVECPSDSPACPTCKPLESCVLIPQSCNACASTQCQSVGDLPGQIQTTSSTPIAAIAGGLIAGLLIILTGIYLVWRFVLRPKKRQDTWVPPEKRDQTGLVRGGAREHSIASTVLTRASNVIQIAYIPGVTGQSPPISPEVVPPMPILTPSGTPHPDTHFFMPNDLRDSTWSDILDNRISLTPSLARASAGTTLHRAESVAAVPPPAQQALRAQANVVDVRPGSSNNSHRPSPLGINAAITNSSIVARNVVARPIEVRKAGPAVRVPTMGNLARAHSARRSETGSEVNPAELYDEKAVLLSSRTDISGSGTTFSPMPATPRLRTMQSQGSMGGISESGVSAISPSAASLDRNDSLRAAGLTALIEDAIKSASAGGAGSPTIAAARPTATRMDSGPFSDIHELPGSS